ncbi:hypothetical protein BGZ61DRAFT_454981 [Ilyonectria robusta]|uniref:uncharacterized protein n=1 Tax=Ilyonectria robusta TaxID=1079257 RepID=UPI001E8E90F2|nr:uncharacterized protein BGZ61DRAFT_454981 [Ilyonectria robusta]KAH8685140.1 hypothetical protein BGZ61DRAFT_454981 [Ilyonectria robusta]
MRPVTCSSLDSRVEKKSILMLDATLLYLNYIEGVVPASISSKQGNKQLPLEIWRNILDLAARDNNSHQYFLVQPQSLEQSKAEFTTLICAAIPKWKRCGSLTEVNLVYEYEYYLARPHGCLQDGGERPFILPGDEATPTVFRIPTVALDKKILFEKLTVPDVIAWPERGQCYLCDGGRIFCAGCRDGIEVAEEWTSASRLGDCSIRMLCPLCMGPEFAGDSISMQQALEWNSDTEGMDKEYDAWAHRRFTELGYM